MCVSGMDFAYVYTIYFIRNSSDSNVFGFLISIDNIFLSMYKIDETYDNEKIYQFLQHVYHLSAIEISIIVVCGSKTMMEIEIFELVLNSSTKQLRLATSCPKSPNDHELYISQKQFLQHNFNSDLWFKYFIITDINVWNEFTEKIWLFKVYRYSTWNSLVYGV
jgi:hypothetical protein